MTTITTENQSLIDSYIAQQEEAAAAAETTVSTDESNLLESYDTFLQILTAQLENQDPTEPMDASEFTNQLVQYSAVEQQININEKLDQMLTNQNSNGITPLLTYVGQYTEVAADGELVVQSSQAMMTYNLPSTVTSVTLSIQDEDGNVIASIDGPAEEGLNRFAWDATLSDSTTAEDGVYSYVLTAENSSGDEVTLDDVRIIGQVTGIETDADGDISLMIGDLTVDDADIKSIFASIGVTTDTTEEEES